MKVYVLNNKFKTVQHYPDKTKEEIVQRINEPEYKEHYEMIEADGLYETAIDYLLATKDDLKKEIQKLEHLLSEIKDMASSY